MLLRNYIMLLRNIIILLGDIDISITFASYNSMLLFLLKFHKVLY